MLCDFVLSVTFFVLQRFHTPEMESFITQLFYLVYAGVMTPVIYVISHTIRYGSKPSWKQFIIHLSPLLVIPIHIYTHWEGIFWLVIAYIVIYCIATFVNHIRWFLSHKDLWKFYSPVYLRRSLWQFFRIFLPIVCYYGICITSYFRFGQDYSVSSISCILLWTITIYYTFSYKQVPYEDEKLMSDTSQNEVPVNNEVSEVIVETQEEKPDRLILSDEIKAKIATRLARAEKDKLHLKSNASVPIYSQYLGTNRTYLATYLKHELNTTFSKYIETLRMEEAIRLLENDANISPALLCKRCGFNDINTFYRRFKAIYGCNPMQYRETIFKNE